jgi:Na+/H+ antiporter NhaC
MAISKGKTLEAKISTFSEGAGNKNVLLMIWIFVLAGAFAATAKQIGAIDATVNLALKILPGRLLYAGLFLASCFISMSIGTSVGTIVALVPVAAGIAQETEVSTALVTAIIVGGSFFGDNLSFISDTTIAATRTQECSMRDKFKVNLRIVGPAALIVTALYVVLGWSVSVVPAAGAVDIILLLPYLLVIILAISGVEVSAVLTIGIIVNALIGFTKGSLTWSGWLEGIGSGISGMGDLMVTCGSMHSRNLRAGILIGRGGTVEDTIAQVGTVEGYLAARAAWELACRHGVDMPIVEHCYRVCYEGMEARKALAQLMERPFGMENDI